MAIRNRFKRDTVAWRIAWRTYEINYKVRLFVWRRFYRAGLALKRRFGCAVITGGTDCDGMRFGGIEFCWTRKGAEAGLEAAFEWADGPMGGRVVTGREGREWEAGYVADTRDRYAEAMGY